MGERGPERAARIEAALRGAFAPELLRVHDESRRHRGHAGAAEGRGHFRVQIVAEAFAGKSRVDRHRSVYAALAREFESEIHALAVHAYTPAEWRARGGRA
jgi:BolA protein